MSTNLLGPFQIANVRLTFQTHHAETDTPDQALKRRDPGDRDVRLSIAGV